MSGKKYDIGLVGLAVMGQNLVLNMEAKGYSVAVYNRTGIKTKKFIQERANKRKSNHFIILKNLLLLCRNHVKL